MFGPLVQSIAASAARHILTAIAGALVTQGIIDGHGANEFVGACMTLLVIAWSWWEKVGSHDSKQLLTRILDQSHHAVYNTAPSKFTPGDIARASLGGAVVALALCLPLGSATDPFFNGIAKAQTLTGHPITDVKRLLGQTGIVKPSQDPIERLFQNIMAVGLDDLNYAKAIAEGSGTTGGKARAVCWGAWVTLIQSQSGANAAVQGAAIANSPMLFTKFERAAQISDALQVNSPFMIACSPVAQSMKMQVITLVAKVAAGGLGLSAILPATAPAVAAAAAVAVPLGIAGAAGGALLLP